jgi:hypothetical protein
MNAIKGRTAETRLPTGPATAAPDIIEFVTDPQLLGLSISPAQETLLRGIYGLPLVDQEQHDIWRLCTEREYPRHARSERPAYRPLRRTLSSSSLRERCGLE